MKIRHIILLLLIIMNPLKANSDNAYKLNNKGIESYSENNYEESVKSFTEALVDRPDSPELKFNRGTALSASGKTDEAVNELERAANTFENKDLAAAAHFNAGNTFLVSGNLEAAIEEYKKAVKLDQESQDIRLNLEIAMRQLEQQQEQEQDQENNEQDQENKDDNEQQDEDQSEDEQENQNEENEEQEQNQSSENQENEQNEEQNQQQPQESEQQPMTPEEAQRLLDAMNNEEKEAFELRKAMMKETMRQGDDW